MMALWWLMACTGPTTAPSSNTPQLDPSLAHVTAAIATGNEGAWRFAVTVQSPDTGCDRYADWWEVLDGSGELLYRRVLDHSHANEQPFTRSGGPVEVSRTEPLWIRAHLHPSGYGGQALTGTVDAGFSPSAELPNLDVTIEHAPPQPDGCAF